MALKTYDQFIKAHQGKAVDIDGVAGAQCVDLTIAGTTVIDYNGAPKPSQMYVKYRRKD